MVDDSNSYKIISVEKAKILIEDNNVKIVDIRDVVSFAKSHIPDAIHVNYENINNFIKNSNHDDNILIYCYKGISSQNIAKKFCGLGFTNIYSLKGGFGKYEEDDF